MATIEVAMSVTVSEPTTIIDVDGMCIGKIIHIV